MKFLDFKQEFQSRPFIYSRDFIARGSDRQILRNQLSRWQKKGLILPLRKGIYIFNKTECKAEPDPLGAANIIYEPSYISLEYALQFYNLIPERVADITSITTRKTATFRNVLGTFVYQHLKPEAFRGFKRVSGDRGAFFIADPEKAVVDFVYLNLSRFTDDPRNVFEDSFRFQNIEDLRPERLGELGGLFGCKKLMRVLDGLKKWVDEVRS